MKWAGYPILLCSQRKPCILLLLGSAGQCCEGVGSSLHPSENLSENLLKSPMEHLKVKLQQFLLELLSCLESLVGGRSPLWLCSLGWSPQGAPMNRTQPNEPGSTSGMGQEGPAEPGHSPPCPTGTVPRDTHSTSAPRGALWAGHEQEFLFPQSILLLSWAEAVWGIFHSRSSWRSFPVQCCCSGCHFGPSACHSLPTTDPSAHPFSALTLPGLSVREFWKTRLGISADIWDACHWKHPLIKFPSGFIICYCMTGIFKSLSLTSSQPPTKTDVFLIRTGILGLPLHRDRRGGGRGGKKKRLN